MEHRNVTPPTTCAVDRIIRLHSLGSNGEQVACPRVEPREGRSGTGAQWHPHTEAIARHSLGGDIERSYGFVVDTTCLTEKTERFWNTGGRGFWKFQGPDLDVP